MEDVRRRALIEARGSIVDREGVDIVPATAGRVLPSFGSPASSKRLIFTVSGCFKPFPAPVGFLSRSNNKLCIETGRGGGPVGLCLAAGEELWEGLDFVALGNGVGEKVMSSYVFLAGRAIEDGPARDG